MTSWDISPGGEEGAVLRVRPEGAADLGGGAQVGDRLEERDRHETGVVGAARRLDAAVTRARVSTFHTSVTPVAPLMT